MSDLEPEHECENCGELRHNLLGGEGIHKCSNVVHKDDLRELVEKMRKDAKEMIHHPQDDYEYGRGIGRRNAADELEAILDE